MMQWHQARRAHLCRPQRRSLIGAAASAQAVEHAARVLQAAGASESAQPAAKALLTTLAKLFAAPRAPCAFHTELQVRRRAATAAAPRRSAPRSTLLRQPLRAPAHDHALRGAGRLPSQCTLRTCCARPCSCGAAAPPCRRSCCHTRRRSCCPRQSVRLRACARWTSTRNTSWTCQRYCRRRW